MTPLAKTDAIRFFAAKIGIFCEAGLMVDVQSLAPLVKDLAAKLAGVGIAPAAASVELAGTILLPLATLSSCPTAPTGIILASIMLTKPCTVAFRIAKVVLTARQLMGQFLYWCATLCANRSGKAALPVGIIRSRLMLTKPCPVALRIAKVVFRACYVTRPSLKCIPALIARTNHASASCQNEKPAYRVSCS